MRSLAHGHNAGAGALAQPALGECQDGVVLEEESSFCSVAVRPHHHDVQHQRPGHNAEELNGFQPHVLLTTQEIDPHYSLHGLLKTPRLRQLTLDASDSERWAVQLA